MPQFGRTKVLKATALISSDHLGRAIAPSFSFITMTQILVFIAVVAIAIGASLGIACLAAWAVTSIWPSIPFWPVALGAWALASLFSKGSSD